MPEDARADIFDTISHVTDGVTGLVRAVYFTTEIGDWVYDVQVDDDIVYATPAKNWKIVEKESGNG